jgi:hypothetical protein
MSATTDTGTRMSLRRIRAMAEWERHRTGWDMDADDDYYQRCPCCHQRVHAKAPDPPNEWDPVAALPDEVEVEAGGLLDEAVAEHIVHECPDAWQVGK